jgi:catechol 2,3-dioxygenase-like lactoylglutathione lyase family enzyme
VPKRWWLNQINTEQPEHLIAFYKDLGFVEDPGFDLRPGAAVPDHFTPTSMPEAMGYDAADRMEGTTSRAMLRLPGDIARVEVLGWREGTLLGQGPRRFNMKGLVRIGLLVDDIDRELDLLRARGIEPVWTGDITWLNFGLIRAAFFEDPDGNLIEYVQGDVENS